MKSKRFLFHTAPAHLLTACALAAFAMTASALEEPPPARTMLVLDASGSMWGHVEGVAKIDIARRVIDDLAGGWQPSMELGLTVYGHRRQSDCSDIETVMPVQALDAAALASAVEGIQPKGKTPMSEAVRQAAEALGYEDGRTTVILVSDGQETCGADPCAVARELEAAGTDFTAHVVGFDVHASEATDQLKCLAEGTGGRFFQANDAASLAESLASAVETVVEAVPPAAAELEAPSAVPAGWPIEVTHRGPNVEGDYLTLVEAGSDPHRYDGWEMVADGNPLTLVAPVEPGEYEIRYYSQSTKTLLATRPVSVGPSTASLELLDRSGTELEVRWEGPDAEGDFLTVVPADAPDGHYKGWRMIAHGNPLKIAKPTEPGVYEVRYASIRGYKTLAKVRFEITN